MQKVFISSSVSQYPSYVSAGGFHIYSDKMGKVVELQDKLHQAVLCNLALIGRNIEVKDKLCNIKEQLRGQEIIKNIEQPTKRTLKHQRNLSQPNMEIEKQFSNPSLKYSQTGKIDPYDLVKMGKQQPSICEEKATSKVISSKSPVFQSNIIKIRSTNKEMSATPKTQGKIAQRQRNGSNLAQFVFETVEQIWSSSKTCTQKRSYLKH